MKRPAEPAGRELEPAGNGRSRGMVVTPRGVMPRGAQNPAYRSASRSYSVGAPATARSTSSSECVISAVLASMIDAEQYFSCDSWTARSTVSRFQVAPRHREGEVDAREDLGVRLGALGVQLDAAALHILAATLEDQHHVIGGAAAGAQQHHFHRAWRQVAAAAVRRAIHRDQMAASGFRQKRHAIRAGPAYCAFHVESFCLSTDAPTKSHIVAIPLARRRRSG